SGADFNPCLRHRKTTNMATSSTMEAADIVVVALYFLLVLAIGLLAMWKANHSTVSGYFLAGRSMNWAAVGASLFVSNIGSEHFIGLAGSGAASGFSVAAWEFNALLLMQLLGWLFIPVYILSGVYTMPEYLAKRFGGQRLKVYFATLSLVLYIFTKLSVNLYTGALFIQESLGWNIYLSIILLIGMTAILTVTGGLVAVIYTDVIQAILMIGGALTLTGISLYKVGGLEGKVESFILRGPTDPDLPWPGFLLGQTPASLWYWCADQVIVQRVLAAKNISHVKASTIMAGFLKILPMFIIVIPGMIARILFADDLICISPEHCMEVCGSPAGCSNIAYPRLVMSVMPIGLRGLMLAVMIAALMSDLDSIFNSASTIFTLDIYKMLRKQSTLRELLIVGRLTVVFLVVISIAWVPVVIEMQGGQMFYYTQEVSNYLTPPIAAMFLLAVLWHRCNETGAFWGALTGFVLGTFRLTLGFIYREPLCDQPDNRPSFIKDVHFMYVAQLYGTQRTEAAKSPECNGNADLNGHLPLNDTSVTVSQNGLPKQKVDCYGDAGNSRCLQFVNWFCGIQEDPVSACVQSPQEHEKMVEELLYESPRMKMILNLALVFICGVTIFLFVYFTL
uniref:Solute carrier family 5 member 3 n=1 Tax=Neogobius melanostomus TaxID=47308 RepID=A0A8C6VAA0_9GOBI